MIINDFDGYYIIFDTQNRNIKLDTLTINFKERIVNVKLKDISTWSTEHLSKSWVIDRAKTFRKVS